MIRKLKKKTTGIDVKEDVSEKYLNPKTFSSQKEKHTTSQSKVKKDKMKKNEDQKEFLKFTKCEYKSKKADNLKIHVITKHELHACKECNKKLKSFMEM